MDRRRSGTLSVVRIACTGFGMSPPSHVLEEWPPTVGAQGGGWHAGVGNGIDGGNHRRVSGCRPTNMSARIVGRSPTCGRWRNTTSRSRARIAARWRHACWPAPPSAAARRNRAQRRRRGRMPEGVRVAWRHGGSRLTRCSAISVVVALGAARHDAAGAVSEAPIPMVAATGREICRPIDSTCRGANRRRPAASRRHRDCHNPGLV